MRVDLPALVRNPISLIGVAVATAMAVVFLFLLALDVAGQLPNPYLGLLLFVAVPAVFVFGLVLITFGVWRQHRRYVRQGVTSDWPVIDFHLARTRKVLLVVVAVTCVNLLIVSLAAFGAVHHMESAAFCGTTCHTTMEPEWAAYQVSPHGRVPCVSCHVGPGAKALVESKIAGTRQLWQVFTDSVPTPVPVPVHSMRPARDTCEKCHWSEKFHGDTLRQIREYADDEQSTETLTTLRLHVGGGRAELGGGGGIHWHMNLDNQIEYIATDPERQTIPWVKLTDRHGRSKEYVVEGTTPAALAQGERRSMDCLDCHNRPAHTFEPSPERAIDNAIASGQLSRELPFVRREAVAAVKTEYPSRDAALAGIASRLREHYGSQSEDAEVLSRAIRTVQDVYARNVFPAMKVRWGTYANHIGHVASPGCFRCHDDNHKASDGSAIAQNCETCHEMS